MPAQAVRAAEKAMEDKILADLEALRNDGNRALPRLEIDHKSHLSRCAHPPIIILYTVINTYDFSF